MARPVIGLVLCAAAGGCSDPTGPGGSGPEEPAPVLESRWDVSVTVRYVRASSELTCDGRTVLGTVNPGEYQYRIRASYGGTTAEMESTRYGSVTGTSRELGPSEIHNFGNRTWNFRDLRAGEAVALTMYSTEWDGTSKDDYMDHRSNTLQLRPSSLLPEGGTRTDRALGVGTSTCGLTLYYDISAVQRQIEVG